MKIVQDYLNDPEEKSYLRVQPFLAVVRVPP